MAAAGEEDFWNMNEAELRQWVEAHPGRVNENRMDRWGLTPLYVAVYHLKSLSLTVWLVDAKGADVNAGSNYGKKTLHGAQSLDILTALLDRGADPTMLNNDGMSPLMSQAIYGQFDSVKRLMQDPRVRASIDMQDRHADTALHFACRHHNETNTHAMVRPLLEAGATPILTNNDGKMPLACLRQWRPSHHTTITLLEQALANAETTALLVKARRPAVADRSNLVVPSCLQYRVTRGEPLPRLALMPATNDHTNGEDEEEGRKFRTMLTFLLGMGGGPEGNGMPRDVFRVVLDMLMPVWDPVRKRGGAGPPVQG